ncbi:MAG TPA: O-antigen ligase family protein [Gemmatimonadales bacterium]|nr:O-antigen ligase family protein [Gemmatimonadales bacterium]
MTSAAPVFPDFPRHALGVGAGNRQVVYAPVVPAPPWSLGLAGAALYIVTAVGRVQDVFPVLAPFHLALVSSALAILCVALDPGALSRINAALGIGTSWCVLGILVWAVLGVPTSLWRGGAVEILRTILVKVVLMYFVLVGAVRHPRDLHRLVGAYVGSVTLYALMVVIRFHANPGAIRIQGLYDYDSNDFATLVASTVPLAIHLAVKRSRHLARIAGVGGLLTLLLAFVWANSRGGFLALLAAALVMLVGYRIVSLPVRLGTALGGAIILVVVAGPAFWARMDTITNADQDYNMTSSSGRWQLWERGIGYMEMRPLLGVGVGGFPSAEGTLSEGSKEARAHGRGEKWSEPHNSFVQVGAELGVPGLLLFIGMLWTAVRGLRGLHDRGLAVGLVAAIAAFSVGGFFLSLAYKEMLYTLVALAAAARLSSGITTPRAHG